jgi:hypothetical protein
VGKKRAQEAAAAVETPRRKKKESRSFTDCGFDSFLTAGDKAVDDESQSIKTGLLLPALSAEYLFGRTIFPLARLCALKGLEMSGKTAFAYELARWHCLHGGGAFIAENENKDSAAMREGILCHNRDWLEKRIRVRSTYCIEEWQEYTTSMFRRSVAQMEIDRVQFPILGMVDSLAGTGSRRQIEDVLAEGIGKIGYGDARAGGVLSGWTGATPAIIRNMPLTLAITNHLRISGSDQSGRPQYKAPFEGKLRYFFTFIFEFVRQQIIERRNYGGLRVDIRNVKNSAAVAGKRLFVDFLWWWDSEGVQQFAWDWDTATVEFLLSLENANGKKTLFNDVMDVVDINVKSKTQRLAWSKKLGVTKESPASFRLLGAIIESREDILTELRKLLHITVGEVHPSTADTVERVRRWRVNRAPGLYVGVENIPNLRADELGIPVSERNDTTETVTAMEVLDDDV